MFACSFTAHNSKSKDDKREGKSQETHVVDMNKDEKNVGDVVPITEDGLNK